VARQRSLLRTAECLGTVGTGTARQLVRGALQAQMSPDVLQITPATTCGSSFRRMRSSLWRNEAPCCKRKTLSDLNRSVAVADLADVTVSIVDATAAHNHVDLL
jgi:hypothetical protein